MRTDKICVESNCENIVDYTGGRGLCGQCYHKHRHRGTLQQFTKHSPKDRFEQCFDKQENGCWIWNKAVDTKNYGSFYFQGRLQTASRVSYILYIGLIPDNMCVCHQCDNPRCVNPKHLFLGTQHDNVQDMINKGRKNPAHGTKIYTAKLTETLVLSIFNQKEKRASDLALEYNVCENTIHRIWNKQTWKHLWKT